MKDDYNRISSRALEEKRNKTIKTRDSIKKAREEQLKQK